MIKTYNIDAWKHIAGMPDKSVGTIITDPMYDAVMDMNELRRICVGTIIMFCAEGKPFFKPDKYAYWVKPISTKNYSKNLGSFVEWIIIEKHGNYHNPNLYWANYTGVYHDVLLRKQKHPFEKPISLLERLVSIFTIPGSTVFDPFFGSGSTLVAADNLGRNAVGCEVDEKHYSDFVSSLGKK